MLARRASVGQHRDTASFLTDVLGSKKAATIRLHVKSSAVGSLAASRHQSRCQPNRAERWEWRHSPRGVRVADEKAQLDVRQRVAEAHRRPTDVNRHVLVKSVYS